MRPGSSRSHFMLLFFCESKIMKKLKGFSPSEGNEFQFFFMGEFFQFDLPFQRAGDILCFFKIDKFYGLMRLRIFCAFPALMCMQPVHDVIRPTTVKGIIAAVKQIDETTLFLIRH